MGLLTGVPPAVSAVVRDAVNDPLLARRIVYRRYTGQTSFDAQLGYPKINFDDLDVRAAALTHSERSISSQGLTGKVQVGDHIYLIRATDILKNGLTKKHFTEKDIILDEGEERKILNLSWALLFALQVTVAG